MSDKEIRADATLKQLAKNNRDIADELWRFRNPEEGGTPLTLEAILVEIPLRYGIVVKSLSTLSEFYTWLRLKRRLDARVEAADLLKEELAKDPDITEDQIRRAGQKLFMTEGIVNQDAKVFAAMVKIGQNDQRLKQNDEKISLDKRRLAILEAKAALADEAKQVMGNEKLTDEEKAAHMRRLFRMG